MFDPSLISAQVYDIVPKGFVLRPLQIGDYHKGYLECLSHLTKMSPVTYDQFVERYQFMYAHRHIYYPLVIECTSTQRIVGCGTFFLEHKFIRGLGKVGHFEDVVTHKDYRGLQLGVVIMNALKSLGKSLGCYKSILDCSPHNVKYYEKVIDFKVVGSFMSFYYDNCGDGIVKSKL